ncbi:MAG: virulence RhuM family protein [Prevotella sp.]|nr:virulence RhuM family protein [Prevotella sp.]MBR6188273.1 virulence RhuM family protein [Prevotella sp.]
MKQIENIGEIVMYQPDETIRLELRFADENAWLNRQQMAELFGRDVKTIGKHIGNALQEELRKVPTVAKFAIVQREGNRMVNRTVEFYSLDMVISVGYRVKSEKGIEFRIWANQVLKEYLLRGYSINYQMRQLEQKMDTQQAEIQDIKNTLNAHQEKIDFFVRTNQPPVEGVLFEGQIFDAYKLVEALVKSAKQEIILIDNYIDATIFDLLEKRGQGVNATIFTENVGQSLQHLQQLNHQQYGRRIEVKEYNSRFHDRFLIIDEYLWHCGASFKDLGRKLFAIDKLEFDKNIILNQLY